MDVNGLLLRRRMLLMGNKSQPILPSGYLECEYILAGSSGFSINTGVQGGNSVWEMDVWRPNKSGGNEIIIGRDWTGANWAVASSSSRWSLGTTQSEVGICADRVVLRISFLTNGLSIENVATGVSGTKTGNVSLNNNVHLFGYNNRYNYKGYVYSVKCVENGNFNGIPAYRVADGSYGIYDIANDVFYACNGFSGQIKN